MLQRLPMGLAQVKSGNTSENQVNEIQAYDSMMCGYFCIRFIDLLLKSKSLLEYKNLFSPNEYKRNDKIILKYFQ